MNNNGVFLNFMNHISVYLTENNSKIKFSKTKIEYFIHLFHDIDDPRIKSRTKYSLEQILAISMYLILKGEFKSFLYASLYVQENKKEFIKLGLINKNGECPSHDTFRYIFTLLDAKEIRDIVIKRFQSFANRMLQSVGVNYENRTKLIIADGKEFKGSGRNIGKENQQRNRNVLNIYDAGMSMVLSSTVIDDKNNEIPEVQRLLNKFNLSNSMVTMDALHCQKETCEIIRKRKGHYTLTVKGNQKYLMKEIDDLMHRRKEDVIKTTFNKIDYEILFLKDSYLGTDMKDAKAYIRIDSHKRGKREASNVLRFISSSKDTETIISTIDNRWWLENGPHKIKDEYFNEDDYRFYNKNAVKVMASLNNVAYSFFKLASAFMNTTLARAKIRFRSRPLEIITTLVPIIEARNFEEELSKHLMNVKR